jgi:hypothetical protein
MGFAPVNIPQLLVPMPLDELAELIQTRYGIEKRVPSRGPPGSYRPNRGSSVSPRVT